MKNRLSKILASCGVASRRHCETIIADGRVSVNGQLELTPQTQVDLDRDKIRVDGELLKKAERKLYFLLNKPAGFLCTSERPSKNSKLVIDLFAHLPERLFTVGRLDRDTTGLLLVTNDGHFAQEVIHPSKQITKEYLAKTGQEITIEHLKRISSGTYVQGTHVKPTQVKKVRRGTIKVTVAEGKKHEVRQLLGDAGLTVQSLSRIRIGPLTMGDLPLGAYRPLSFDEINSFGGT